MFIQSFKSTSFSIFCCPSTLLNVYLQSRLFRKTNATNTAEIKFDANSHYNCFDVRYFVLALFHSSTSPNNVFFPSLPLNLVLFMYLLWVHSQFFYIFHDNYNFSHLLTEPSESCQAHPYKFKIDENDQPCLMKLFECQACQFLEEW